MFPAFAREFILDFARDPRAKRIASANGNNVKHRIVFYSLREEQLLIIAPGSHLLFSSLPFLRSFYFLRRASPTCTFSGDYQDVAGRAL